MAYDSLNHARKLKRLGVPEQQAVAHAQVLTELIKDDLATKKDLISVEVSLKDEFKTEIRRIESKFELEFQKLDSKIDNKFNQVVISMGGIFTIGFGLLFTALKYLP